MHRVCKKSLRPQASSCGLYAFNLCGLLVKLVSVLLVLCVLAAGHYCLDI
jgi:hypothetical protein